MLYLWYLPSIDLSSSNDSLLLFCCCFGNCLLTQARFEPLRDIYATLAKFEVVVKDTEMLKLSRLDDSFDEYSVTLYDAEKMLDKCKTGMRKELETQMDSYNVQMTEIRTASQTELPFSNERPHKEALEIIAAYKGEERKMMLILLLSSH